MTAVQADRVAEAPCAPQPQERSEPPPPIGMPQRQRFQGPVRESEAVRDLALLQRVLDGLHALGIPAEQVTESPVDQHIHQ